MVVIKRMITSASAPTIYNDPSLMLVQRTQLGTAVYQVQATSVNGGVTFSLQDDPTPDYVSTVS